MCRLDQPDDCLHCLESDADSGKIRERVGRVVPVRVDDGIGRRQGLSRLMVVGDDDGHAEAVRIGDGLARLYPAVRSDDESGPLLVGIINRRCLQIIAVALAVRNPVLKLRAQRRQGTDINGGRSHAVHIIVAVNKDRLAGRQGVFDPVRGLVHVGQAKGVMELAEFRPQEGIGGGRVGQAPVAKQTRRERMNPQLADKRLLGPRIAFRFSPACLSE